MASSSIFHLVSSDYTSDYCRFPTSSAGIVKLGWERLSALTVLRSIRSGQNEQRRIRCRQHDHYLAHQVTPMLQLHQPSWQQQGMVTTMECRVKEDLRTKPTVWTRAILGLVRRMCDWDSLCMLLRFRIFDMFLHCTNSHRHLHGPSSLRRQVLLVNPSSWFCWPSLFVG